MPEDKRSTHIPAFSGTIETVTGSLIVDTGLQNIQSLVASLAEDSVATKANVTIAPLTKVAGATVKAQIKVWEDDNITLSSAAASVGWMALGN
jgi:hypothetical protein